MSEIGIALFWTILYLIGCLIVCGGIAFILEPYFYRFVCWLDRPKKS